MSVKFLCVIACTLLLVTFFNTVVSAQTCLNRNISYNATACTDCDDFCGTSLKTSSCCSAGQVTSKKNSDTVYSNLGVSSSCRQYYKQQICAECSPSNQQFISTSNYGINVCKSFCEKLNTECASDYAKLGTKQPDCSTYPTTNCYNSGVINQVSALAMFALAVVLGVFAL
ncbi:predicted protein [Naegleria gruberi]|uniref:Predicted protein n=1 Tax=Naegleria gruberi TaxID=5762 RepID=D2VXC9_NAEGR|nr:uncharacterized protein NAEGRDRAFT_73701 [Naegleria gruberi]EFC38484.1 predicted protein [Naegleria gruberi]|eukprot:XP_002671228.1 predicted protein [Naegleria gruberi strain NEG-M]